MRLTHAHNMHAELEAHLVHLDLVELCCTDHAVQNWTEAKQVIVQAESPFKVPPEFGAPDVLVLGEVEPLCRNLVAKHVQNSEALWRALSRLYQGARMVIAAGADAVGYDGAVSDLLLGLDPQRRITLHHYRYLSMKRTLLFTFSPAEAKAVLWATLQQYRTHGRRSFVACGSKTQAGEAVAMCVKLGVPFVRYDGDTEQSVKRDDFRDIDGALKLVGCLISTATLQVGVDIRKTVFYRCFAFTHRSGCSMRDMRQLLCRAGRLPHLLEDTRIVLYVNTMDPQCRVDLEKGTGALSRAVTRNPRRDFEFYLQAERLRSAEQVAWHNHCRERTGDWRGAVCAAGDAVLRQRAWAQKERCDHQSYLWETVQELSERVGWELRPLGGELQRLVADNSAGPGDAPAALELFNAEHTGS